jgi:hypothetical protein
MRFGMLKYFVIVLIYPGTSQHTARRSRKGKTTRELAAQPGRRANSVIDAVDVIRD